MSPFKSVIVPEVRMCMYISTLFKLEHYICMCFHVSAKLNDLCRYPVKCMTLIIMTLS